MKIATIMAATAAVMLSVAPAQADWHSVGHAGGGWHGGGWHGGGWGGWWGPWGWWGPIVVAGITYSVIDGIWYRDYGYGYVPVSPPPGYELVPVGPGGNVGPAPSAAGSDAMFAYPRNGQTEQQQSTDRFDCNKWAVGQTGFDPTQNSGGVAAADAGSKRADYRRADTACLEGKGYTVR